MKFYEKVRPLRIQIESLGQRIDLLACDLKDKEEELIQEKLVSFNMTGLMLSLSSVTSKKVFVSIVADLSRHLAVFSQ